MKRLTTPAVLRVDKLADVVEDLAAAQTVKFDICICDGLRMHESFCTILVNLLGHLKGESRTAKISKLILVTSSQFSVTGGETLISPNDPSVSVSFDSWQEEDYKLAMKSDLVRDSYIQNVLLQDWLTLTAVEGAFDNGNGANGEVIGNSNLSVEQKMEEAAILKYYIAGGCARFMFQWTVRTLQRKLSEFFDKVPKNEWTSFTTTNIAVSTNAAVNSLMQKFSSGPTLCTCFAVSKYVLLRAHKECRDELTKAMYELGEATENPVLQGWAFELGQLDQIQLALEANQQRTRTAVGNSKLTFIPEAEMSFDGQAIIHRAGIGHGGKVANNSFIRCLKYNQGCFDAALYFNEKLVTLQFTRASTHSLKLEYLKPLYTALTEKGAKVEELFHLGIVDERAVRVENFKFDEPTGTARNTRQTKACGAPLLVNKAGGLFQFHIPPIATSKVERRDGTIHYVSKLAIVK